MPVVPYIFFGIPSDTLPPVSLEREIPAPIGYNKFFHASYPFSPFLPIGQLVPYAAALVFMPAAFLSGVIKCNLQVLNSSP